MQHHIIRVALAYAKKQTLPGSNEVAVLFRSGRTRHQVVACGVGPTTRPDIGTATANLLFGLGATGHNARGGDVAVTGIPTDLCLGTARLAGVRRVLYLQDGQVHYRNTGGAAGIGPVGTTETGDVELSSEPPASWMATDPSMGTALRDWARTVTGIPGFDDGPAFLTANCHGPQPAQYLPPPVGERLMTPAQPPQQAFADAMYLLLSYATLARLTHLRQGGDNSTRPAGLEGHNIACILVGPNNTIIGWGINTRERNGLQHGEVNCLQNYQMRNGVRYLPQGSRLYTTLEPCYMCAGMLSQVANGLTVIYGHEDPTIHETALSHNCERHTMRATEMPGNYMETWGERLARLETTARDDGVQTTTDFLQTGAAQDVFAEALTGVNATFQQFIDGSGNPRLPNYANYAAFVRQAQAFLQMIGPATT